jgi:hypothetical protein
VPTFKPPAATTPPSSSVPFEPSPSADALTEALGGILGDELGKRDQLIAQLGDRVSKLEGKVDLLLTLFGRGAFGEHSY